MTAEVEARRGRRGARVVVGPAGDDHLGPVAERRLGQLRACRGRGPDASTAPRRRRRAARSRCWRGRGEGSSPRRSAAPAGARAGTRWKPAAQVPTRERPGQVGVVRRRSARGCGSRCRTSGRNDGRPVGVQTDTRCPRRTHQIKPTPSAYASGPGRWIIAIAVLGSGLAFLDGTVVNVALPEIGRDLDASTSSLQWILNGYLLTLASLILLGGSLGDRYGRRRDLRPRRRRVHGRLPALRDRADRRGAGRRAAPPGDRRGAAHPGQPGDDRGQLPARRPRAGDRRLVGPRRRRDGDRAAARRLPGRRGLVAGDLPDQPPDRALRHGDGAPARPRDPRPDRDRTRSTSAAPCSPRSAWRAPPTR